MEKNRYFATFTSGMQLIIKDILEKKLQDVIIGQIFDGAILFETEKTYNNLDMHCFNNIFSVILYREKNNHNDMGSFIKYILKTKSVKIKRIGLSGNVNSFRFMASSENRFVSIDNNLKNNMEKFITSKTGLKPDRSNSDTEFWLLYRSEGYFYFLERLSKHTAYEKILNKGELHPEIAYLMNWLSEPDENDIVLDPFCGHGSIPVSRALHFPAKQILANDINIYVLSTMKNKIDANESLSGKIKIRQTDILNLENEIDPESIDKIITDPPWGLFDHLNMDSEKFYQLTLSKMERVLRNNGIIVLLLWRNIDIAKIIEGIPNLKIIQDYNVLVSGKKANLYKINKSMV